MPPRRITPKVNNRVVRKNGRPVIEQTVTINGKPVMTRQVPTSVLPRHARPRTESSPARKTRETKRDDECGC
ncbi:hypothetical protein ACWDT6_19645 [Nocardia grenadensis]